MADIKGSFRDISIADLERELNEELAVELVDQIDTFLDAPTTRPRVAEPPPALELAPSGTQPPEKRRPA